MSARWGEITAAEVLSSTGGRLLRGSGRRRFSGFTSDSRKVTEGCLFWALQGERYDGQDFVVRVLAAGAAGAVVRNGFERELPAVRDGAVIAVGDTLRALGDFASWWRQEHRAPVAAITGSAGKSTTKEMTASILTMKGETLKNPGNYNNLIGLPSTLLMLEEKHRYAVLEMGMNRPGEIGRLTEIADPEAGVITNVAKAHLEGVGTLEGVARAKVEMIGKMSSRSTALLNGDDPVLMRAASSFGKKMVCFGLGLKNDVRAENIRSLGLEGTSFEIHREGEAFPVILKAPGLQNVRNALAASAAALCLGASSREVTQGLGLFRGMKGRFMVSELPGGVVLVDDTYNCNPLSLRAAVDSLKTLRGGRRVIVGLGEMYELGDETLQAHLEAGAMVAELEAAFFAAFGEHGPLMVKGAVDQGFPGPRAVAVGSREEMEQSIREETKPGDLIFLKGSRRAGLDMVAEKLKAVIGNQ